MGRFLLARTLQAAASLLVAVTLVFVAVTVLPSDPVRALFGFVPPPPELYEAIRREYRLDRPLPEQYVLYLADLLRGDLGRSLPLDPFGDPSAGVPVSSVVRATAPVSAVLLVGALVVQLGVGVVAGALAARGRRTGVALYAVALLLVSTPVLVSAYVARVVFGVQLRWFPASGIFQWQGYVLPTLALAALATGFVALLTRAEVRSVLAAPYVAAARGRGLPPSRVLGVHALRPALVPVVTFVGANTGQLFVGLLVVEAVFSVPGLGGAIFNAVADRDRALLVGLTTVVIAAVIVVNAVADVLVALLDPRVRHPAQG